MNLIHIWITLPDGQTVALGQFLHGEMVSGTAPTAFRYLPDWINHPRRFTLTPDPKVLPLDGGQFDGKNLAHPFQIFEDALPDRWGQRLLAVQHNLSRQEQNPFRYMELVGADALGALTFSITDKIPGAAALASGVIALEALVDAAERYEAGEELEDPELQRLCAAGATPGGARPKAKIGFDNRLWLAKFPSRNLDAGQDVVGLEATCMTLAAAAGLEVPTVRLMPVGARRVLLVERFDVTPAGGRRHMATLRTLCREGHTHVVSYNEPVTVIRRFSDDADDVARFFRQVAFNAAIGNTDDHLKNFSMFHDDAGWRLTPAYDLVPDIGGNRSHQMAIGTSFETPSGGSLLAVGEAWIGNRARAEAIIAEVVGAVRGFEQVAQELGVEKKDIDRFGKDIRKRLDIIES